jgi:hypothetical protein
MPSLFHVTPALMRHDRSGEVVGSGFSREQQPQLRPQSGYSYRVVELLAAPADDPRVTELVPCPR